MKDQNYHKDRLTLERRILSVESSGFEQLALDIFHFQRKYNETYGRFLELLGTSSKAVKKLSQIPFLPISLFKNHLIQTGKWTAEAFFESSGTTGQIPSRHAVRALAFYKNITASGFEYHYGDPSNFCFLGLLPSYLERKGSSLVLMADHFMNLSKYVECGFFLNDHHALMARLMSLKQSNIPTVLIGVSFGLLDFVEKYQIDFPNLIVMETGGMKGRRHELTRSELHDKLKTGFRVKNIHSEYGMTELFSQAYSKENGHFTCSPSMKVLLREITDPFSIVEKGKQGVINIIDLANLDTCSFIATDDLGRQSQNDTFEVLGRLDNSDLRGCSLMVA